MQEAEGRESVVQGHPCVLRLAWATWQLVWIVLFLKENQDRLSQGKQNRELSERQGGPGLYEQREAEVGCLQVLTSSSTITSLLGLPGQHHTESVSAFFH